MLPYLAHHRGVPFHVLASAMLVLTCVPLPLSFFPALPCPVVLLAVGYCRDCEAHNEGAVQQQSAHLPCAGPLQPPAQRRPRFH
jgi:hypothetical protein